MEARLGCEAAPDLLEAFAGQRCGPCSDYRTCLDVEHGRFYVGSPKGTGFRTNMCPRTWADSDFVREVVSADFWASRGGGFDRYVGESAPAILFDSIHMYRSHADEADVEGMKARRPKPPGRRGAGEGMQVIGDAHLLEEDF